MKLSKFFLMAFAVLLCTTGLSAQNSNEAQYTNGFTAGLRNPGKHSEVTQIINLGYYFAKNNCMSFEFGVTPYIRIENLFGVVGNDGWFTSIGASLSNYIPLARSMMKNMLFFDHGVIWSQYFGGDAQAGFDISSSWFVGYKLGLQYRLNPKLYFGVCSPVGYSQTILKDVSGLGFTNKESAVPVFNSAYVYLTYMF
ncbi:MAG: hypothetical protein S4CHLAM6_00360 [Chlamydiae bacterium]|nr:hypothetical protein [Chlamydiota bacterium]